MLNKLPCLDKGWVALVDSSLNSLKLRDLRASMFYGEIPSAVYKCATLTLAMKAPLFIAKALTDKNLNVINAPQREELEAYLPTEAEIGATDLTTSREIAKDIERTTAALLMNAKAYQADGCDRYIAQVLTPISVYTTFMVTGTYAQWSNIVATGSLSPPLRVYLSAVDQILKAEWMDEIYGETEDTTEKQQR